MCNVKDKFRYVRDTTYTCNECETTFKYWIAHPDDWEASGYEWKAVCKPCFEKKIPNPRYMTCEEIYLYAKEMGYNFYPDLEKKNQEFDNLKRKLLRKFGVLKSQTILNSPEKFEEPKEIIQKWICTHCRSSITTKGAEKPPEICQNCGK